jgi:hypothetical protein
MRLTCGQRRQCGDGGEFKNTQESIFNYIRGGWRGL